MKDLHLKDIWRELKPDAVVFLYSASYKSYSRIDYFLISVNVASKIKDGTYDGILISDHAPNSLLHSRLVRDSSKWRIQQKWLQDSDFVTYIGKPIYLDCVPYLGKPIDLDFETNTLETSASIRWEAFKAFI